MSDNLDIIAQYVDNFPTSTPHFTVKEAAYKAIRDDSGYRDLDPDTFEDVKREGREAELHASVGIAVRDVLVDMFADDVDATSLAGMILHDILNNIDRADLGEQFMPESADDYREWYEDNR